MAVVFTNNITPRTRSDGINLLGYYWRASPLSQAPYYPFDGGFDALTANLDSKYPTFIEYLGDQMSQIQYDQLIDVMQKTAAKNGTNYPIPANFADTIIASNGISVTDVVAQTASDTVASVASAVDFTSKTILYVAIFIGLGYVLLETGLWTKLKIPHIKGLTK